jgi:hypothetical protein
MNYQRTLGLVLYALGLTLTALVTVLTRNPFIGFGVGAVVIYIGWRIRWAA